MTPETLNWIACDDPNAVDFLKMIDFVVDVWDDLIDRDKMLNDRRINDAFWTVLIEMPKNPFYAEHFEALNALIAIAIKNWELATQKERTGEADEVSFVLRSTFVDIFGMVAVLTGGYDHATEVIKAMREGAHTEGMAGYINALDIERQAREG